MNRFAMSRGLIGVTVLLTLGGFAVAQNQPEPAEHHGHSHEKSSLHGGSVTMTDRHHFEVVFAPNEVRIYMYSGAQTPLNFADAKATATLKTRNGHDQEVKLQVAMAADSHAAVYYCSMHPEVIRSEPGKCPKCGMTLVQQNMLMGRVDLKGVKPGDAKLVVQIKGLEGQEPSVTFTENYRPAAAK